MQNTTQDFLRELNRKDGTVPYRLPTEAEWEYSCGAGSSAPFCFGDDETLLSEYAWYADNSGGKICPAGKLRPNAWGLYDMHGNVKEWCQDRWGLYPPADLADGVTDPVGPATGKAWVVRGCSFYSSYFICRSAFREGQNTPLKYVGFRVAGSAE